MDLEERIAELERRLDALEGKGEKPAAPPAPFVASSHAKRRGSLVSFRGLCTRQEKLAWSLAASMRGLTLDHYAAECIRAVEQAGGLETVVNRCNE